VLLGAASGLGPLAIALFGSAALAVPVLVSPITGTLLALGSRPLIDCFWNLRFIQVGSLQLNFQSVVGVSVPIAAWFVVARDGDLDRRTMLENALLVYAALSLIGVVVSPVGLPAVADFSRIVLPLGFYWIGKRVGLTGRMLHGAAWVLASYGLIPLIGAGLQLMGAIQPAAGAVGSPTDVLRVTGFYHHPLDITMRAGIGLPFAFVLARTYRSPVQRNSMAMWGAALALTSWAPLVRSALVATLVETSGFLYMVGRRWLAVASIFAVVAGAALFGPTRAVITEAVRPLSTGAYTELASGRGLLFAAQVAAFQRATIMQKVIGRGLHSTPGVNRQFAPFASIDTGESDLDEGNIGAHNQFLRVLTENGLAGLFVFMTVLVLSFRAAARAGSRSFRTVDRTIGLGVLLLLIAIFIYGLSGTPLDLPSIAWPTWFAVGLAAGIASRVPSPGVETP
jgi:hypothetical protein